MKPQSDRSRTHDIADISLAGALAVAAALIVVHVDNQDAQGKDATVSPDQTLSLDAKKLALGYRLAAGTDAALWDGAPTFLIILDSNRTDAALWTGFARLARMAAERQDPESTKLAKRLLLSAEAAAPPAFVGPLLGPLRKRSKS